MHGTSEAVARQESGRGWWTSRRRVLLGALLLGSLGAGCTGGDTSGAPTTTGATTTYEPVQGRVVMVGDSLTVGSEENLQKLAERHGFTLDLSAANGRQIPAGVAELERLGAPSADLVVVALGTNDAARTDFDRAAADGLIDDAMAATGDAPVLWVDVYRDPGTPAGDAAAVFDAALVAAEDRHPTLSALDWSSYVLAHPDVMAEDRIHHTTDGYVARSRWVRDAIVEHLSGRPAATSPATSSS